jgi:type VII secretion integral membrane protein EccD
VSRRVTVVGSTKRLDAALPESIPVAELLADLVDLLGESENGVALEWGLVRVGGLALDPELSLAEQGVAAGTMLFLRDRSSAPAAPLIDDFAGRVAIAVDAQSGRWTGAMPAAVFACVAAGSLAAAGLAVLVAGTPGAQTWTGMSGAVLAAVLGFAQLRVSRRRVLAAVVAFSGLPAWLAAGAGIAGLAGASLTGIVAAGLGAASVGSLVTIAVLGEVAFAPAAGILAATGIPAVVAGAAAAFGGGLIQAAAPLAAIELIALALLAPLSVRLAGIAGAESASLASRLARARNLSAASLIGTALAITAACGVLAVSNGWFSRALVVLTAVAMTMRARHYRFAVEVVPLVAGGIVSLILLELQLVAWLPALLIADAVVLGAAATLGRQWRLSPQARRWLSPAEGLAITASVPLAMGVLGFYDWVARFAHGLV